MFHYLPSTHLLVTNLRRNSIQTNLAYLSISYIGFARRYEPQKSMPLDTNLTKPISFVYGILGGLYYCLPIYLSIYSPSIGELVVVEIV